MPSEDIISCAVANLRATGLPEPAARTLAGRIAGVLEQLRRQSEALSPVVEPSTLFSAGPQRAAEGTHK